VSPENAIKFSGEGGTVKVDIYSEGDEIIFDVIDHGVGLEDSNIIFDLFVQENMNLNRIYGGVGLGLTIVKNLVVLQGGRVQVKSKVGQGSCFSVHFSKNMVTAERNIKIGRMA